MKVLLTGGNGMLGRAVLGCAAKRPELHFVAPGRSVLDLTNRSAVRTYFSNHQPEAVVHLAARVGGIQANVAEPADFYLENTLINLNVIAEAHNHGVQHLINIGSSCMYPKDYGRALREIDILAAPLEPTNEGYALSKIGAARHCEYLSAQYKRHYRTLVPCNLYGRHDEFRPQRSHLIAAVVQKISDAVYHGQRSVVIWGDGTARREFLYVDDLASYIISWIGREHRLPGLLNVGAGTDLTVSEYHEIAAEIIGYNGEFEYDLNQPVGMKRKLLDTTLAQEYGWQALTPIREGIEAVVQFYQEKMLNKEQQ